MTPLAKLVRVAPRYQRSVNVESDATDLSSYVVPGRALYVLERVVDAVADRSRPRSWSITGPYGAGKSTFAVFLTRLFGPSEHAATQQAWAVLARYAPSLARRLRSTLDQLGVDARGAVVAVATAEREPMAHAVARAVARGCRQYWSRGRRPAEVAEVLRLTEQLMAGQHVNGRELVLVIEALARRVPVLLLIDEFGKTLEWIATERGGDVYLLQQLAERANDPAGPQLLVFTLQHLAFDEYLRDADLVARQEWRKVQGRVEDIPFGEVDDSALGILSSVFELSAGLRRSGHFAAWAATAREECARLGLDEIAERCAEVFPLHPLTAVILPHLCRRYGQHERTLFTFLSSGEPESVPDLLRRLDVDAQLPCIRPDSLFDYFASTLEPVVATSTDASRWFEIHTRIAEARGLTDPAQQLLKTIGVLNLVAGRGAMRASRELLRFAACGPVGGMEASTFEQGLQELIDAGLVVYRGFADEYRVWEGTDLNLNELIEHAKDAFAGASIAELLDGTGWLEPLVAARHSQRTGILRFFERRIVDRVPEPLPAPSGNADGLIIHVLDSEVGVPPSGSDPRPVLVTFSERANELRTAALEWAALTHVLTRETRLRSDRVARREVEHRLTQATVRLRGLLGEVYDPTATTASWWQAGRPDRLRPQPLAELLSDVCDAAYSASPRIDNEMLSRRELTSQGAKARRNLLEAMIAQGQEARVGLEGYGPERAMYEAVLAHSGIHRRRQGQFGFGAPRIDHPLRAAWDVVVSSISASAAKLVNIDVIYEQLAAPPIGMKEGPIPVLLTAALLSMQGEVGIYQDGTFQPELTVELVERMVKDPRRFAVRHFALTGARRMVVADLAALFGHVDSKVGLLAVVTPLVHLIRRLPEYTLRTTRLSPLARQVRDAIRTAREPDVLLFEALPQACALRPFTPESDVDLRKVTTYREVLREAVEELNSAFPAMLDRLRQRLGEAFGIRREVENELRARASRLIGRVIDQRLKSVLVAASAPLSGHEWIEAVAMNLVGIPPRSWRDEDVARAELNAAELGALFRRVEWLSLQHDHLEADEATTLRRLTLTAPDGTEHSTVVALDSSTVEALTEIVDDALDRARNLLGAAGPEMLASLLAEAAIGPERATADRYANAKQEEAS